MSREAELWAWKQIWCNGSVKLILISMCKNARAWTYRGSLSAIAAETGMSIRSVKAAISIFRQVQRVALPKRGTYEFMGKDEVQSAAPSNLETLIPEESNKEVLMVSPRPPSFTQEKLQLLPAREGQQSLFEFPEWAQVINDTAEHCGGAPLTQAHVTKLEEKAKGLDLLDEAHNFDSHHRTEHDRLRNGYPKFATYKRFSGTWIEIALKRATDGKTGKSGKHLVSNREGRDGAFADPSRYHD